MTSTNAPVAEQLDILGALGVDVPTPAPRPARQCGSRPTWRPTRRTLACADCYELQHQAAVDGRRIPCRHRVAWLLTCGDEVTPLCTEHAEARGRTGGAR